MSQIKIDSVSNLEDPKFIRPIQINYTHNDKKKVWEAVEAHDSVATLIHHEEKHAFILVKQFRPPVFNSNGRDGMTYELCAGIVDKDLSLIEIAKEEILEECGYDIPLKNIQKISTFYSAVGISGTHQTVYFATCNDTMKVNDGGGLDEEEIEVIYIPIEEAKAFIFDESYQKTPGLMMSFYWFFDNINI